MVPIGFLVCKMYIYAASVLYVYSPKLLHAPSFACRNREGIRGENNDFLCAQTEHADQKKK